MKIGSYEISDDNPRVFVIAEISANHNGSLDNAIETIRAAKWAGADCIKLQTYTADTITIDSQKNDFIIKGTIWKDRNLYSLYKEAYTPWEWHKTLFQVAKDEGLISFSSPFDRTAVDFLEKLDVPAYKIASFEITDIPLIEYVAKKEKPVIISTGIASKEDVELAVQACRQQGNNDIALLKCTSSYPASVQEANLKTMVSFRRDFKTLIGVSDHTLENIVPISSVALGAKIIEKHFILDRSLGGPDSEFSLNPNEFKEMVKQVRLTEMSLGLGDYPITEKMNSSRQFARSLYFIKDISQGEIITEDHVKSIRPGYGLHPKFYFEIVNKTYAAHNFKKGDRLSEDSFRKID
jgi:pseudaminic acid synthase